MSEADIEASRSAGVSDAEIVHHGAKPNTGKHTRRGYAVRYTGEGATYHVGPGVNPRITNDALQPGEPLDSAQYPVACDLAQITHEGGAHNRELPHDSER